MAGAGVFSEKLAKVKPLLSVAKERLSGALGDWNSASNLKKLAAAFAILAMLAFFLLPQALDNTQTVRVVVRNAESGEPVEGASVLIVEGDSVLGLKRTRSSGIAEFGATLSPARGARVEAQGYHTQAIAQLEEKNEVKLLPRKIVSQTGTISAPSQPAAAFAGKGAARAAAINPPTVQQLEAGYPSHAGNGYAPPSDSPGIVPPDCTAISSGDAAAAIGGATVIPTGGPTVSGQPTAQASAPKGIPETGSEFTLKYGKSVQIGGEAIEFYDYTPDGKIRLRVSTKTGEFTAVLSQSGDRVELASGHLEFVYSGGEPPSALLRFYSKQATPTASGQPSPATPSTQPSPAQAQPASKITFSALQLQAQQQISVKIGSPKNNDAISEKTTVSGSAASQWGVYSVEVSTDGGTTWKAASGASKWVTEVDYEKPGPISLKARATDCRGNTGESEPVQVYGSACKALIYHGPHASKYDVVLIPSKYQGDADKFSQDAQNALETVFSTPPFNTYELYSKFNIYLYNGDASCKIAGDKAPENRAWKCEVPKEYFESCTFADQAVVFVNSNLRAGKSGNPIVASAGERKILVHEMGHGVFGLADEYCCDGGYWEKGPQPNIYETREKCERQTGRACDELGTGGWSHIRIERGIMEALDSEHNYFDESDLPSIRQFIGKYE